MISGKNVAMAASVAASLLGATGAAHAATVGTATANLTAFTFLPASSTQPQINVETGTGSGTGTLDSSGTFTINYNEIAILNGQILPTPGPNQTVTITGQDTFTGTIAGNVFTPSPGGGSNVLTCTGSSFCPSPGVQAFKQVSGSFSTLAGGGGVITGTSHPSGTSAKQTWTISDFTPTSPVPVPAAVWLLGSGLLGLFSTSRRRVKGTEA